MRFDYKCNLVSALREKRRLKMETININVDLQIQITIYTPSVEDLAQRIFHRNTIQTPENKTINSFSLIGFFSMIPLLHSFLQLRPLMA